MMKRKLLPLAILGGLILGLSPFASAYPQPSKYPVSWELKFEHEKPRRIVVETPGSRVPKAYWYMTYTVTNNTDSEQMFLPTFEMVTRSGKVIRSDRGVPKAAFDKIKSTTGNNLLETAVRIAGPLRVGEDQAKDGVAIWEEPEAEMGAFTVFVSGLAGESAALTTEDGQPVTSAEGKPLILFKTLQLDYVVSGDEVSPGVDPITKLSTNWIMR
jgi:hypothetical protein